MTVTECSYECKIYSYFARQCKGECWCGDNSDYDKYGEFETIERDCYGENVRGNRNCVYEHGSSRPPIDYVAALGTQTIEFFHFSLALI